MAEHLEVGLDQEQVERLRLVDPLSAANRATAASCAQSRAAPDEAQSKCTSPVKVATAKLGVMKASSMKSPLPRSPS